VTESKRIHQGKKSAVVGIVANTVLAAIKIVAGVVGRSYALIADGIESVTDIFSSLIVWSGLKIAAKPPDANHPYGHGKAEPLAAVVVAVALFAAAIGIAVQSLREILTPHHAPAPFTLVVLLAVIVTKEILFRYVITVGESINSTVVKVDAWHHRSDAITSLAAFLGISIALLAGEGYESADDWGALVACLVISYNGYRLLKTGISEIMDGAPPTELEDKIRAISRSVDKVVDVEKCRIRKSGLHYFVDLHVTIDGNISVQEGHDIGHSVKTALCRSNLHISDVLIHIEPDTLQETDGNRGIQLA